MHKALRRLVCAGVASVLVSAEQSVAGTASSPIASLALAGLPNVSALPGENVHLDLAALTADGSPAPAGAVIRVALTAGTATFAGDATTADAATDSRGHADVVFHANAVPQTLTFRVTSGDVTDSVVLDVTARAGAQATPAVVVGIATAGMGPVPGAIEAPDGAANGTLTRRGAIAMYASGAIARDTHATVAYATADTLDQTPGHGAFVDNPNDRPFPIYGDASARFDDTPSRSHLYARVDRNGSSAMWGEFSAQGGTPDASGGYNVLVNGAKLHVAAGAVAATAFTSHTDVAFGRVVLSPTGLGVANQALQPNIVVGSDVVTLISVDRQSGALLAQRVLARGTDYTLDAASGQLRFITILLPFDAAGNPQNAVVQYEYTGAGAQTALSGANAALRLGSQRGRADAWYLNDATGAGNLSITGAAVRGGSPALAWSVSGEQTNGNAPLTAALPAYANSGASYRARFATLRGPLAVDVALDNTSAGYQNPYGTDTTPGLSSVRVSATQRLSTIAALDATYFAAKNILPPAPGTPAIDNADVRAGLALTVRPSHRLRYHLGVRATATSGTGPVGLAFQTAVTPVLSGDPLALPGPAVTAYAPQSGNAVLAGAGASWDVTPRITVDADRLMQLSTSVDPYEPAATQVGVSVATNAGGRIFVRQNWQRASVDTLAATQQNATYAGTARSTTTAGVEQRIGDTTIESGYAVDSTTAGFELYEAIGARRTFRLSPALSGDGFVQSGRSLSAATAATGSDPNFFVAGTSLAYVAHAFSAAAQVQVRTGYNSGSTYLIGATGPVTDSLSLFGSTQGAYTAATGSTRTRAGLSFRPAHNDRYVTLLSVDSQTGSLYATDGYVTNVAQLQELVRFGTRTEIAASLAYKITGDATFAPRTTIYGLRADQRIGPRFDLGAELHQSAVAPIGETNATGVAVEAGVRVGDQLRIAAGYNASGYANPQAAVSPTHRGLYATISTVVDRIFGWGAKR